MNFFMDLVARTDEARRSFETHPALTDIVANGLPLDNYRRFLLELYHIVWHFNPVCAAATSRIGDRFKGIRYFLYRHVEDEAGHEEWVLNDLEAIGVDRSRSLKHRPSPYTLALTGYNYWTADRCHACSVLGMLYALEVIASVYGGPFSSAMKERLLLEGDKGISFISSHATLDSEHMAELRQVLNTIDDSRAGDAIVESACMNFHHFTKILESV